MAMTEFNFTRDQCPDMLRCTTTGGNVAVQVNIPAYARRVTIVSESGNGCRIALFSNSDNIHDDYLKVKSYGSAEFEWYDGIKVANAISKIYVANKNSGDSDPKKFTVVIEGADR